MKTKRWTSLVALTVILTLLVSCRITWNNTSEGYATEVKNAIQATLQVLQTQTAAVISEATQTATVQPSATESPASADTPGPTPTINPTPCNVSKMVRETIPDGTKIDAGDVFTKSWTLRNNGACDWSPNYRLVFDQGNRMGGKISQDLGVVVRPGQEITLSLNLIAPDADGDYTGVWRLVADDGEKLGSYWANIVVGNPVAYFAVTSVDITMSHTNVDTTCPNNIHVKAIISNNAAGKITYYWKDSTGNTTSTKSYTMDAAGEKTLKYEVSVPEDGTGNYKVYLYIDEPNHQMFGPLKFHVECVP